MKGLFDDIVITEIHPCADIFTASGKHRDTVDRMSFALIFSTTGCVEYYHNGNTFVTDEQHFVLAPKGETYHLACLRQDVSHVINFECNLELKEFCQLRLIGPRMLSDAARIVSLSRSQRAGWKTLARELLYRILAQYCELRSYGTLPDHLSRSIDYLYLNYSDPTLTNATVARHAGISQIYLQKEFVRHLSISPKRFLQNIRMEKAKHLISATTMNVSEIAAAVGYASLYHFSRAFKQETGLAPSEFRKSNEPVL